MITKEVLKNTFSKFCNISSELYKISFDYIKDRLSSLPNNEIYFNFDVAIAHVSICGTNVDSCVKRVYLENGDIYADTEDCDGYNITCASAIDLYKIASEIDLMDEK